MKLLASVLALLVLLLSAQPVCGLSGGAGAAPVADCCDLAQGVCNEASGDHDQPGNEEGCGQCNPFQSCTCCVSAVLLPAGTSSQQPPGFSVQIERQWGNSSPALPNQRSSDFWQPPRPA